MPWGQCSWEGTAQLQEQAEPWFQGLDLCCSRAGGSASRAGQGNLQGWHKSPGKILEEYKTLKPALGDVSRETPAAPKGAWRAPSNALAWPGMHRSVGWVWIGVCTCLGRCSWGRGRAAGGVSVGLPAPLGHLPVLEAPTAGGEGSLASDIGQGTSPPVPCAGSTDQESPAQGTSGVSPARGVPSPLDTVRVTPANPRPWVTLPSALQGPASIAGTPNPPR